MSRYFTRSLPRGISGLLLVSLVLAFLASAQHVAAEGDKVLKAVLRGTEGNEQVFGLVSIVESGDKVTIEATVEGLSDGGHGFHIHTYGDEVGANDGTAAGGHFNPNEVPHSGPGNETRHVGDLGNISSQDGTATYEATFTDDSRPTVSMDLMNSVIGRSFVIHAKPDDLVSQPTGDAGSRVAIGVIGIGNDELYEGAEEVVEHIDGDDFAVPDTLVCKIVGEGIEGFGAVTMVDGIAEFRASLSGLSPGPHGIHIHWYGDEYNGTQRNLTRAGGHYNPSDAPHALPDTDPRHYGDGGNIIANDDGKGTLVVSLPPMPDLRYLVGRTCLVHADEDDGTGTAGNAGARIAAGQLGYANPETNINVDDSVPNSAGNVPGVLLSIVSAIISWIVVSQSSAYLQG